MLPLASLLRGLRLSELPKLGQEPLQASISSFSLRLKASERNQGQPPACATIFVESMYVMTALPKVKGNESLGLAG